MLNAILEIGCEEIPARFMPGFLADLKNKALEKLKAERLEVGQIITLGTYRRLTLYIEGLAKKQADLSFEAKGPPAAIAFDQEGKPTKAAIGFAKTQGLSVEKLEVRAVSGKDYVFAKVLRKGQTAEKVLAKLFPEIITTLYQPLAMRWGNLDFKFIRPIHWLLALCGSKVVKFSLAGVKSGNTTVGHRYTASSKSQVTNSKQISSSKSKISSANIILYKKTLAKLGVIVDQEERKVLIRKQVEAQAKKEKVKAFIEPELLDEVTFLVENPIAYVGKIDPSFLKIPQAVLTTSMRKNQKYFPLVDARGKLAAKFVVITDGCKNSAVVAGNQKVLSARLSDAKFFFEEDQKQPLKARVSDLKRVGFFKGLGSMSEKAERVGQLAAWLGKQIKFSDGQLMIVAKIAELSKADLTTKMVYEFPELQGVMGREYSLLAGEDPKVAEGIFEHYLPRSADDELPQSIEGTVVALADRFDSLVGCFSVGSIPTGSVDPYGLRRAVQGIIRIIIEKKLDLLLDETIDHAAKLYQPVLEKQPDFVQVKTKLVAFIAGRLKPLLLDQGIRYDVADAVLADFNDILDVVLKAQVIQAELKQSYFPGVVASADRVARIAKNVTHDEVVEASLVDPEEKDLYQLFLQVRQEAGEALNKEEWAKAIQALAKFTEPLETFFAKVMVMHKDERIKTNRLALLCSLKKLYLRVADFSKIVL